MAIIFDEQGNLVDTENRVQFGNENFDSEPYQYTPNYLGANSPMLDEGDATLSSTTNYGYDPAFGQLESQLYGDTSYPGSGKTYNYADFMGEVPSLQRGLGDERFALAPEQPQGIAFNNPVGGLDQYAREMEALEAARGGQEVSVNQLGGTLQDFYTNRNPGTNANTKFEVIDDDINFNTQPQNLGFIEPATVPKEAIYQDRIMNRNLSNSNYEPRQGILQGLQDKIGAGFNNVKDFAMDKGRMGRNLLGSAGAMALGLPGIVGSGAMALMGGLKNQFQDRQLTGDIQDEYGNMYSADELNSQNALGGYYTDPARSARRRTSRIAKMRARDFNNKKISQTNLDRLVRQEKAQQLRDAKDAADRANIQNVQNYTGRELSGYRMSRPASERNYTGGSTNSNPSARGAQDSFSNKSGMGRTGYQEGGLASMFTRRR
jgi:hypothetical protein